ncbi:MAG: hypothetical protein DLM62_04145 [Pseudonocardiales bacterium]|nr:MAG: hypothetical protein DLM62_04145 [Pseudonocardiales bacterium]
MTDIEQHLREELKAAASRAQPYMLRDLALPPRRRGAGAARWLAPAAAVIAVIAIIVGAQVIFRAGRSAPRPVAMTAMPRFYVSVLPGGTAVVARSATGAVISRVVIPGAHIDGVSGAADDRTFVLAAWSGSGAGQVTRFYAFHLAAGGRPGGLTILPLSVLAGSAGYGVTGVALSPDARTVAVAVVPQSLQTTRPTPAHRSRIEIATLGSAGMRTWVAAAEVNLSDLSWADGRHLGYLSDDLRGVPRLPGVIRVNLLDTARPGGDLTTSSTPVTPRTGNAPIDSALVTAGGRMVIAWTGPGSGSSGQVLAAYSTRTGHRQRVLYQGPGHGNFVVQGDLLSADRSGRHVLMSVLTVRGSSPVLGRLDNGRFTTLPSPARSPEQVLAAW